MEDYFAPRLSKGQDDDEWSHDGNTVIEETRPQLKKPSLYRVVLFNDDYTPMEFVVELLEIFFNMTPEQSTAVMLKIHTQGKAACGVYTRDIAETKAMQVNEFSRQNEHPLLCEIEPAVDEDS